MYELRFVTDLGPDPLVWARHNMGLVALSIAMAIVASILGMYMAHLGRQAPTRMTRNVALASGALAFGSGIWAMHFIGMLAYDLCAEGDIRIDITILSMVPSVIASGTALLVLRRPSAGWLALVMGGIWMGAGIGVMHYLGMMASTLYDVVSYDLQTFVFSVLLAVLLSIFALWLRFGLQQRTRQWPAWALTMASGTVMGLAIACMHYMGMAAIRMDELTSRLFSSASQAPLAWSLAMVSLCVSLLMIAVNLGLRYRMLLKRSLGNESQLQAVVDTAVDGIVMIDASGTIQAFNGAAERMLGWSASEVVGRNVNMLMPEPFHSQHDQYLSRYLRTGEARIIGGAREVYALRRDGVPLPVRLAVGRVHVNGPALFVGFLTDISQRRNMEQTLRRSEEQFRTLIDNIPGVTFRSVYDKKWPMQFVSDSVFQLTGWPAEDFLAGRVSFIDILVPEDAESVWKIVTDALENSRPYSVEYRIVRRDGQVRWCSEGGRGIRDDNGQLTTIDGVILDNTMFKERNAEYEGVVMALYRGSLVVEYNMQGRLLSASPGFCELTGYTLEELQGKKHGDFGEEGWRETTEFSDLWRQLQAGRSVSNEYSRRGNHGRKLWVHVRYSPILGANGKPFKVMGFVSDLTVRREMEQALRAAKERAELAAATSGTFLANMSHEIRTPMNAILGFTNALLDTTLNVQQRLHLETVHQAARSLLRLLNDILDTAKLEKGAVALEQDDFAPRDLFEQVLASLGHQAAKKQLNLDVECGADVPGFLWGDAFRLQQVLLNLVGNAIKFTETGQVLLQAHYVDGVLRMEVVDTGVGIAPDKVDAIFAPFAQADVSTTRQYGGTGLGTTISRQLVELMSGSIDLRSTLGEGSVFTVRVPLPVGKAPEHHQARRLPRLPPLRILAADDVANNLELLELTLLPRGHQITRAEDGAQAVAACRSTEFDVVLMDLQMPGMDGLEATRKIRENERAQARPHVPIIALSASVLERDRSDARASGMDGFATKPLEPLRLLEEMARVLDIVIPPDAPAETAPDDALTQPLLRTTQAIDWDAGMRLWGTEVQLHSAIQRFLRDQDGVIDKLQEGLDQDDWPGLRHVAHRLCGAAGNLSLKPVYALADIIETAADDLDRHAVRTAIVSLAVEMQRVCQALSDRGSGPAAPLAPPVRPDPSTRGEIAQALALLEQLRTTLAHSEVDEANLHKLNAMLPADQVAALNAAVEQFDLERALGAVEALLVRWRTLMNEES